MGRKAKRVSTLHGYTLEELIDIKNTHPSKYVRRLTCTIVLRYQGYSPKDIMKINNVSNVTINKHLDKWNNYGAKALEETRGGNYFKVTSEIEANLIDTVLNSSPCDYNFVSHTWTCALLSQYILNTFGESISKSTIHSVLKRNNLSYKRAQAKPTKSIKAEQERFKKNVRDNRYYRIL